MRKYGWRRDHLDKRDIKFVPKLKIAAVPDKVSLYPLYPNPGIYDQGALGSCHDAETEVLTDKGWKLFSDISIEDRLASVDPDTGRMIFEVPIGITIQPFKGKLICCNRRGVNFKVTPNHKMLVRKWNEKERKLNSKYELVEAKDLGWYAGLMNRVIWEGKDTSLFELSAIPNAKRKIHRIPSIIPMYLWMKFLGIFLAEGTALKEKNKIQLAAFKEREKSYIRQLISDMGIRALELKDRFTFCNKQIHNALCELGLFRVRSYDKFVPSFVFDQSTTNIKSFLEGHFMGDGCEDVNRAHYTSSGKLASGLQQLIFMSGDESGVSIRGPRTSIMKDGRVVTGKHPEYRVSVCENKNLSIDKKEDIFLEDYDGIVYCAEVPTYHTLITKRDNAILISGNCTSNALGALMEYEHDEQILPDFVPSRLFVYYNERVLEDTVLSDAGAEIRDGIKTLAAQGACDEKLWPYDITQFAVKPPQNCYDQALNFKAITYFNINQTLTDMQSCLAEGNPFVFGWSVYSYFESPEMNTTGILKLPISSESLLGGHACLCVGYDNTSKMFLIRNSWGLSWGPFAGYFYMPYEYILDPQLASDFWKVTKTN